MAVRCSAIRLGTDQVGLGGDGHQLGSLGQRGDLPHQVGVARADLLVGRQADTDHVDLGPGGPDQVVEPLAEQRPRLVQPGGVDQHQLGIGPVHDAADRVPGGLRLGRGDRDLAADQGVGQRRLARVGPADEAGEAGPEAVPVGLPSHAARVTARSAHWSAPAGVGQPDRDGSGRAQVGDHRPVGLGQRSSATDHGHGLQSRGAPEETAIATATWTADSCRCGSATLVAAYVRPSVSRTAGALRRPAVRARAARARVMILRSSGSVGSGVGSLRHDALASAPGGQLGRRVDPRSSSSASVARSG